MMLCVCVVSSSKDEMQNHPLALIVMDGGANAETSPNEKSTVLEYPELGLKNIQQIDCDQ